MANLNEKIAEVLAKHEGGEVFFDHLDATLRGDMDIINTFFYFIRAQLRQMEVNPYDLGLVLSGSFGSVIVSNRHDLIDDFGDIILTNGGIREGKKAFMPKLELVRSQYIFIDDSFYSGTTREGIRESLLEINRRVELSTTFVIYDGGKVKDPDVKSMYRYYK